LLGENAADEAIIDKLLHSMNFPIGPFELIALVGLDVNYSLTFLIYNAFF
jgi:3-hydroxybutyryl-CoA dehydrogenase